MGTAEVQEGKDILDPQMTTSDVVNFVFFDDFENNRLYEGGYEEVRSCTQQVFLLSLFRTDMLPLNRSLSERSHSLDAPLMSKGPEPSLVSATEGSGAPEGPQEA